MAASMAGGAITQYPLGRLSDRLPRRRVILGMSLLATGIALVGTIIDPTSAWVLVVAAAYGGLAFPLYSVAVSHVNDVTPQHQLIAVAAGLVFVFGVGAVVGPVSLSVLMEALGPVGYFWGLAIYFVPLGFYALVRIVFNARPSQRQFVNLPPRSSTAAVLLAESSEDEAD